MEEPSYMRMKLQILFLLVLGLNLNSFMNFLEKTQETNNFLLEPISIRHSKVLFELLQPPQLYTYIPINAPKSIEVLEAKFEKWEKRYSPDKKEIWLNYAIRDKKDLTYKGTLQSTIIKGKETYIAYQVFPKYWRRGIARECVSKLIEILFNKFYCKKISAHIDTRNMASLKLLESLEFKCTQKINEADFFKGSKSNEFVYELANTTR